MTDQPKDYIDEKMHEWPSYLEIRAVKLSKHVTHLQTEINYLRTDKFCGWFASGLLMMVLGLVLYKYLEGAGVSADMARYLYLALGITIGCVVGGVMVYTRRFWVSLINGLIWVSGGRLR